MEKIFCTAVLLSLGSLGVYAQTASGTLLLGGGIGYSNQTSKSTSAGNPDLKVQNQSFDFTPRAGLFVADNLAVGVQLGLSSSKTTGLDSNTATAKATGFNVGPFVRYYKMIGDKAGLYGQLGAGYSQGKQTTTSDVPTALTFTTTRKGFDALITPGFVFFPIDKLGLELSLGSLGYSSSTNKTSSSRPNSAIAKSTTSRFGTDFGFNNLMLGASFYLSR